MILACERFLKDLENSDYEFKKKNAEFVINIIEKTFVHVKGDLNGQPFLLEPWEKFICYNLAGFYLKNTTERRFKEAFIFIPRKNGKTPFAAAIAWALSLLDKASSSTLYIIANKLDRALESFNIILENIKRMGIRNDFKVLNSHAEHSVFREWGNGSIKIQALASNADKADGLNANLIILDEIHAYKSPNDYFVYKQAMKAYTNKLLIGITTAGKNMQSFCYQRLQYCQKILNGSAKDEEYFVFICKADDPDDYLNPIEHEKANPNYGITIRPQDIENEAYQAQNDPSSRNDFLNKSLNIYTDVANAYFNITEIQESDKKHNFTLDQLAKLPISWIGGADLSVVHDLTGACLYGEYKDVAITITHGFIPIVTAKKKADEDNIPLFWWKDEGWLTLCNSDTVEYIDVVNWFAHMRKIGFKIKTVAFDKFKAREFVRTMKQNKFNVVNSDQQYWKKSEAFREIERKIKQGNFYYLHNRAFEYCIQNVHAIEDPEERIRFSKIEQHRRIDLFDCTVIACKQLIVIKDDARILQNRFAPKKQEGEEK